MRYDTEFNGPGAIVYKLGHSEGSSPPPIIYTSCHHFTSSCHFIIIIITSSSHHHHMTSYHLTTPPFWPTSTTYYFLGLAAQLPRTMILDRGPLRVRRDNDEMEGEDEADKKGDMSEVHDESYIHLLEHNSKHLILTITPAVFPSTYPNHYQFIHR